VTTRDPFAETLQLLRDGDAEALRVFVQTWRPAVERLAARRIRPDLQRRVGPESIAQSVCRTFLRRAAEGQFEVRDEGALWGLLCAVTLTKVRDRVRHHRRAKRDVGRELPLEGSDASAIVDEEEAFLFEEQMASVLASFDDEERQILELRLSGHAQLAIAELLACSERTVRRKLRDLEARLREALAQE